MDDRLEKLEAQAFAHGLLLKYMARAAWPDTSSRSAHCDTLVSMLEGMYEREKVTEHGHPFIQMAIAEIEALFGRAPPKGPTV